MGNKRRIGILGGTFNPIHLGHLMIAEMAFEAFDLERVIFVPAYHPPHKTNDVISAKDRYAMVRVAVFDNPHFTISDIEMVREGPSYTVDTIRHFKTMYGDDVEFYFIAGMDSIHDLPNWKYIDELLELCHFIGAGRPGSSADIEEVVRQLGESSSHKIHLLEVPEMRLSATDLRRRLRSGKSTRYMIPKSVFQYIRNHKIYDAKDGIE